MHLVADIGGTNARFALVRPGTTAVIDVVKLKVADHATPQDAAAAYLAQIARRDGSTLSLAGIAFAIATPVESDTVKMTNSPWIVSRVDVGRALGTARVTLINDFEALALSLPDLAVRADDTEAMRWVGAPRPDRSLPMAVIGPGTGLGVGGCVPSGNGWTALPGEGGHVTAAASDDFESDVLREMRREFRHVSAERVLSGMGMPSFYRAVCRVRGVPDAQIESLDPAAVTQRALEQGDEHCKATLDTFCAMLGSFAGNVALTVGARGGVFIGGGIVPRLGDAFAQSRFRERFEAKGRFQGYQSRIATGVIVEPHAALAGAARALLQG
jgi:glucokinase